MAMPKAGVRMKAICRCGDYRDQHEAGDGPCRVCRALARQGKQKRPVCTQFELDPESLRR